MGIRDVKKREKTSKSIDDHHFVMNQILKWIKYFDWNAKHSNSINKQTPTRKTEQECPQNISHLIASRWVSREKIWKSLTAENHNNSSSNSVIWFHLKINDYHARKMLSSHKIFGFICFILKWDDVTSSSSSSSNTIQIHSILKIIYLLILMLNKEGMKRRW
jgi:hypothetical protein